MLRQFLPFGNYVINEGDLCFIKVVENELIIFDTDPDKIDSSFYHQYKEGCWIRCTGVAGNAIVKDIKSFKNQFGCESGYKRYPQDDYKCKLVKDAACEYTSGESHLPRSFKNNKLDSSVRSSDSEKTNDIALNIYPTTNNDQFTLELQNSKSEKVSIEIVDLSGQLVYNHSSLALKGKYQHQVDLSNQACSGMYIVKVQIGNELLTQKIIIK